MAAFGICRSATRWLLRARQSIWHPAWCTTRLEHINFHFRQGGEHKFAYDFETLKTAPRAGRIHECEATGDESGLGPMLLGPWDSLCRGCKELKILTRDDCR